MLDDKKYYIQPHIGNDYTFPMDNWQFEPPLLVEEFDPEMICTTFQTQRK